jgi:hypothetical protein
MVGVGANHVRKTPVISQAGLAGAMTKAREDTRWKRKMVSNMNDEKVEGDKYDPMGAERSVNELTKEYSENRYERGLKSINSKRDEDGTVLILMYVFSDDCPVFGGIGLAWPTHSNLSLSSIHLSHHRKVDSRSPEGEAAAYHELHCQHLRSSLNSVNGNGSLKLHSYGRTTE